MVDNVNIIVQDIQVTQEVLIHSFIHSFDTVMLVEDLTVSQAVLGSDDTALH